MSLPALVTELQLHRFHPTNPEILYAILNATPPRSRASKSAPRHGFVSKWDTKTWKLIKIRKVAERAVTCFDVRYWLFNLKCS